MRKLALAIPLALALAPLGGATASADEIIDACRDHDIMVRVNGVACVGVNYPGLPPSGG